MKSLLRLSLLFLTVLLLLPASGTAAKKNWHLGDRTLKEGAEGHDVKVLQNFLSRAGDRTTADGAFGAGTTKAVRAFEAFQQRPVDGIVTHLDVLVLRDVVTNGGAVAKASTTGGALPKNAPPSPQPVAPAAPAPLKLGPGMKATVGADGLAVAPALAPPAILAVIDAGNKIAKTPYIYGGGHGKWEDAGYDCSGSVSYALHGGGLLETSMASGEFMTWGDPGLGQWITLYANGGHIYMVVAGLRFDTSGARGTGTRWQAEMRPTAGYEIRHPPGL